MSKIIKGMRLNALIYKEILQIMRDPSAIVIAFILPIVLLFLFATAVSLDIKQVPIGIVQSSNSQDANTLYSAFKGSHYFKVYSGRDREQVEKLLIDDVIDGFVVIPSNFKTRLVNKDYNGLVQVITDGTQPNTASFVTNYTKNVVQSWLTNKGIQSKQIPINSRVWYNPDIESKQFLVPGAIGIVMTMIGTMLTALVIAREWERGTMEALLSTPTSIAEILLGKLIPYFLLGMIATLMSAMLAQWFFNVPFQGSWFALICISAAFMIPALAQGLLISTLAKNQFIASMVALLSAFLPAFLLSGFLFEVDSMPFLIRLLTEILAVKYFITCIQAVFLTGDVWALFLPNIGAMLLIGIVLFAIAFKKTHKSLE
ncbi:ABC transporter permease [Psychromonas sp. PT13]|uniref:ABC transporter permease n=1 Tax=Psychromonas sp. PT13 TaxID=3439547 RepID=UPI003EB8485B